MAFAGFCKLIGLDLEPFQRRIATAANGPERELAVLLPRGNGKTTLLAAIALYHLMTVERAEVYCAAAVARAGPDPVRAGGQVRPRAGAPEPRPPAP